MSTEEQHPPAAPKQRRGRHPGDPGRYIPMFWRSFVPNATVLGAACVVLIIEPANGRIVALVGGLTIMLAVTLVVMRHSFAPLRRLTGLMERVDLLRPGERVPVPRQESEVSVLARAFNRMLDRLEAERRESGRRALRDREDERRRLSAELHDEIGQRLTALALELNGVARRVPGEVRPDVLEARDNALSAVDSIRRLATQLRPEALDDLGLVPALTNLTERLSERTGLRIERDLQRDLPPLDADTELVVYRVMQESLTNVIRHADAVRAHVSLRGEGARIVLRVADDGRGLPRHGVVESGIRGMRERAVLVGGRFDVHRRPQGGTEVVLEVPAQP